MRQDIFSGPGKKVVAAGATVRYDELGRGGDGSDFVPGLVISYDTVPQYLEVSTYSTSR